LAEEVLPKVSHLTPKPAAATMAAD
jgi:hypothetical protein